MQSREQPSRAADSSNTHIVSPSVPGRHSEVIRHRTAQVALRDHFLRWQCRVRQDAVRKHSGRPSAPMRPRVVIDDRTLTQITVVINRRDPYSMTPEIRHIVLRTQDPQNRLESGLHLLAADYYQRPAEFSDRMTALFAGQSPLAESLSRRGDCILEFVQSRQRYALPCAVEALPERDPDYQSTYWHNRLFNAAMPPGVCILAFRPDWAAAEADPAPH